MVSTYAARHFQTTQYDRLSTATAELLLLVVHTCYVHIVATLTETGVKRPASSSTNHRRYQGGLGRDRQRDAHPVFLETSQNISVGPGDRAVLKCRVQNLGTKTVSRRRSSPLAPVQIL